MSEIEIKELARLLAVAYAGNGDEDPRLYTFGSQDVPPLRPSEEIVVTVMRRHKARHPLFIEYTLADVVVGVPV